MTRLYRLRSPRHVFVMDDPRRVPDYNRPYAEDDPFVLKMPGSFELVPGQEPAAPPTPTEPAGAVPRRSAGRPKGTLSVPRDQIVAKFRALSTNYGRRPTQKELVANLEPRIEVRTLQDHLTAYELPWPIE
jgi:hypothetical protein